MHVLALCESRLARCAVPHVRNSFHCDGGLPRRRRVLFADAGASGWAAAARGRWGRGDGGRRGEDGMVPVAGVGWSPLTLMVVRYNGNVESVGGEAWQWGDGGGGERVKCLPKSVNPNTFRYASLQEGGHWPSRGLLRGAAAGPVRRVAAARVMCRAAAHGQRRPLGRVEAGAASFPHTQPTSCIPHRVRVAGWTAISALRRRKGAGCSASPPRARRQGAAPARWCCLPRRYVQHLHRHDHDHVRDRFGNPRDWVHTVW